MLYKFYVDTIPFSKNRRVMSANLSLVPSIVEEAILGDVFLRIPPMVPVKILQNGSTTEITIGSHTYCLSEGCRFSLKT